MTQERHISITENGETFHFWRKRLKDEMPALDCRANPWVWFGKKQGGEVEVCGVKTLREAKEHFGI
jgi:hypothetical protein